MIPHPYILDYRKSYISNQKQEKVMKRKQQISCPVETKDIIKRTNLDSVTKNYTRSELHIS